ncbi:hypothetical protein [Flindersiella endophytica]
MTKAGICTASNLAKPTPLNLKATDLVRQLDQHNSPVYGTAAMVGTGAGGVDIDVPEELEM